MLMYHDASTRHTELVQSSMDSHFKLAITVHDKTLSAGTYVIMVAPMWHASAFKDEEYLNIRLGIYAPAKITLQKFQKDLGLQGIAKCFEEVIIDQKTEDLEVIP